MVHVVDNRDPFTGQFVLSRGIVGSHADAPTVASPLHKQVFDLGTGAGVGDPTVSIAVHAARVVDGTVEVGLHSP